MHDLRAFPFVCAGLLGLALLRPCPAAAWPDDPNVNVPLCIAGGSQSTPITISDGAGGAIVTWPDGRNGNSDIYAQRISADGTPLWTNDGVPLCINSSDQQGPTITSDGAGGAIVAWFDWRNGNYDIYAQHILADGTPLWAVNGVAVCANPSTQQGATIAPDDSGGAIVAWRDHRNVNTDIYVQRISAAGAVHWTADGVALCTATGNQQAPMIVADGAGGAIVTWTDDRAGNNNIYVRRILADGTPQWTADGVALCTESSQQYSPTMAPDDSGGAIVTWQDYRSGTNADIYVQRVSADGTPQWTANGVALCTVNTYEYYPTIAPDDSGGAIVTWQDYRSGNGDIYAQRISASGTVQWTADGVVLCAASDDQWYPTLTSDGAGGAIVTWYDERSGDLDIYAQRIPASGVVQWTADGVALCSATGLQYVPTLASDGAGGAIVAWCDNRNGNLDIYAQRVWADGTTPVLLSLVSADVGADFITLTWLAGGSGSGVATVYRSSVGGGWTRIGAVMVDGTGYLRYTDRVDATATRVGYRLGIVDAGVEGFYGEVWVDLPTLELALCGVQPNPSLDGVLLLRFTLPSAAPARVELVDVSGRRVVERELGSLGAGPHSLDLGEGRRLAPGLYLVRLTQGTSVRVTRVTVLR